MPSDSGNIDSREIVVETITDESMFTKLAADWNALAQTVQTASVFLSHEWFLAAWAWRKRDADLFIIAVRRAGKLVGVLPLVREHGALSRQSRRIGLLTVPDTQVCDLIVAATQLEAVSAAIAQAMAASRDWDLLQMRFLAPDGNIVRGLLPTMAARSMQSNVEPDGSNPFIPLDGTWTDFYASRSRSLKKANNLATNRLGKAGTVRIEHIQAGDAQSCTQALAAAIDVSRRSWKQTTGNSLDQPGPNAFIHALTLAATQRGWLSIWLAYLDDHPVAMEYQLLFNGNVHALRADFDATREEVSPGSYLFRHLLESLFGQGLACYFMGPGENAYKARWTDQGVPVCIADCYSRTARGRVLHLWALSLKPRLRRVRNALTGLRR